MRSIAPILLLLLGISMPVVCVGQTDTPDLLRLGDIAPPLDAITWIQGEPAGQSQQGLRFTVLEFWASWCPLSRTVLSIQDSLQTMIQDQALQFIAITHEDSVEVQSFLQTAEWSSLIIGSDPEKVIHDSYIESTRMARDLRRIPTAFVISHEDSIGWGHIVWMGPIVQPMAEDPLEAFEAVLDELLADTYDLSTLMEEDLRQERIHLVLDELHDAVEETNLDVLADALDNAAGLELTWEPAPGFVNDLNTIAWTLVSADTLTDRALDLAEQACEIAVMAGGDNEPFFIDTYARVLWEIGRMHEALDLQRQAVEMMRASSYPPNVTAEFVQTLNEYLLDLDMPLEEEIDLEQEEEEEEAPVPTGVWSGTLNDAWAFFERSQAIIVRPSAFADTTRESAWEREMENLKSRFFPDSPVKLPEAVTDGERVENVIILYGTPDSNPLTRLVLDDAGISLDRDGVRFSKMRFAAENPILITCLPNPWNRAHPIRLYTAFREDDASNLNRFFHGPTALVIGSWEGRTANILWSLDYEPLEPGAHEVVPELKKPPANLSREAAFEDLAILHELLRLNYAGYDDIEWELHARGSSWVDRENRFWGRIDARQEWSPNEFFDLMVEFLEPIEDSHFRLTGVDSRAETYKERSARFISNVRAFFCDVRVEREEGAFRIVDDPPHLAGAAITEVDIIESPHTALLDTPYLFPTLLPAPAADRELYLLGVLSETADSASTVDVTFKNLDGATGIATLPLHRCRVKKERRGGQRDWRISYPPATPIPLLEVRSMNMNRLEGMSATAEVLRDSSRVILDLRGNVGGSDMPAMDWCTRMNGLDFDWTCSSGLNSGETSPLHRWTSFLGGSLAEFDTRGVPVAEQSYSGELFILIDKGVASSGESFTLLADQIENAILLGENTAGCSRYGNVVTHPPLPNSEITLAFGRSKFVVDCVKPNREGVGFFPDYWLDVEDPIAWIADYAAAR